MRTCLRVYFLVFISLAAIVKVYAEDGSGDKDLNDLDNLLLEAEQHLTTVETTVERLKENLENTVHNLKATASEKAEEAKKETQTEVDKLAAQAETEIDRLRANAEKGIENVRTNAEKGVNKTVETLGIPAACAPVDCNNRGTCVGSKDSFMCICNLGYSGKTCEDAICESNRDCNGRGICLGTVNSLTCLCNIGFTGRRCETLIT